MKICEKWSSEDRTTVDGIEKVRQILDKDPNISCRILTKILEVSNLTKFYQILRILPKYLIQESFIFAQE